MCQPSRTTAACTWPVSSSGTTVVLDVLELHRPSPLAVIQAQVLPCRMPERATCCSAPCSRRIMALLSRRSVAGRPPCQITQRTVNHTGLHHRPPPTSFYHTRRLADPSIKPVLAGSRLPEAWDKTRHNTTGRSRVRHLGEEEDCRRGRGSLGNRASNQRSKGALWAVIG